jgi:hypothetical protein
MIRKLVVTIDDQTRDMTFESNLVEVDLHYVKDYLDAYCKRGLFHTLNEQAKEAQDEASS